MIVYELPSVLMQLISFQLESSLYALCNRIYEKNCKCPYDLLQYLSFSSNIFGILAVISNVLFVYCYIVLYKYCQ